MGKGHGVDLKLKLMHQWFQYQWQPVLDINYKLYWIACTVIRKQEKCEQRPIKKYFWESRYNIKGEYTKTIIFDAKPAKIPDLNILFVLKDIKREEWKNKILYRISIMCIQMLYLIRCIFLCIKDIVNSVKYFCFVFL